MFVHISTLACVHSETCQAMHQCALKTKLPVLKINQVIVNLLNVHVGPEKVIVAVYGGVDSGEESVELLQQVELPLCLL